MRGLQFAASLAMMLWATISQPLRGVSGPGIKCRVYRCGMPTTFRDVMSYVPASWLLYGPNICLRGSPAKLASNNCVTGVR
jgi:hypothetical protein